MNRYYKLGGALVLFFGLGFICLLSGCARHTDPINEINDNIQQSVVELVDYAQNNMDIDTDKQFLINGVKDCAARADAMTATYTASMETCRANQSKLKLERNGLVVIIALLVFFMFRTPLKTIGKKFLGL